jgi:Baseplate J-like protein
MGAQFICGNANRRILITQAGWNGVEFNGIDYLEVVDHNAPAGYLPQQTLLIKLFRPVPSTLGVDQVKITGGVRYPNVGVTKVEPLLPTRINDDLAYYTKRYPTPDDQSKVLVVRTDSFGDYSNYTLSLRTDLEHDAPPAGFDIQLSHVDFSFKVECAQDFDCKQEDECPPPTVTPPAIDYLAKDYNTFRRVIVDRLSSISPNWPERNPADAGMVVAELLAWAGDQLSYYQDAVATEAYLGTARRRLSVRRHARLLDYHMHEGANARALVCVELVDEIVSAQLLRQQLDGWVTTFLTQAASGVQLDPDQSLLNLLVLEKSPRLFEPMHDSMLYRAHNSIDFYTWGDADCCLPKGATKATLIDSESDDSRLRLMAGDILIFEEKRGRVSGIDGDADPARRQAVRLTSVKPSATRLVDLPGEARTPGPLKRDLLTGQPIVEIEWHVDDALTMPFCISTTTAEREAITGVSAASGNVVLVDDGRTIVEPLSPATFDDPRRYRPQLKKPEITHGEVLNDPTSAELSAVATLTQDPHNAVPRVSLQSTVGDWNAQPDLLGSDATAHDLVVEMDEGGYAELRFGDGMLGQEPEANMTAVYRIGRGLNGNVGPETIVQVMTGVKDAIKSVRNPLAAAGGAEPESLDEVKQYAPQAFRVQERAVTEADYAEVAGRHPEVLRAVATRRWTGSWYTVFLTVERAHGLPVDAKFRDEIATFVEQYRLAGEDLEIEPPVFVPLKLVLVICVETGYFRNKIEEELHKVFGTGTKSDGTPAFFAPDQFTFGQPVYLSQVIAAAMSVAGVAWIDPTDDAFIFQRANEVEAGEIDQGYIPMDRLEIAQCESSPSAPENGQVTFILTGGQ